MVLLGNIGNFSHRTFLELAKTIFGVSYARATRIASACGISPYARVKNIPEPVIRKVEQFVITQFKVGRDARQIVQANIKKLQSINSYRTLRMQQGLPAHGQRSHTNAKTAKKFGRVKNIYFRTDVFRFRSDDPRGNYVRKGRKDKPIYKYGANTKFNVPVGSSATYKTGAINKKIPVAKPQQTIIDKKFSETKKPFSNSAPTFKKKDFKKKYKKYK